MTVPEASQFLAFARAGRVRLEFGNPRHIEALEIGRLVETWQALAGEESCRHCAGWGIIKSGINADDRPCSKCNGRGYAPPPPPEDLDEIRYEVEQWQSAAATV